MSELQDFDLYAYQVDPNAWILRMRSGDIVPFVNEANTFIYSPHLKLMWHKNGTIFNAFKKDHPMDLMMQSKAVSALHSSQD